MRILFAAGGTAGHINPAIAIAKHIRSMYPDWEICFVGTMQGMEKKLVTKEGFNIRYIEVKGFRRQLSIDTVLTVKALFKGMHQARKIIRDYKPDIVVGTGGYVSGPVVMNATLMKIPTIIHEQNAFPGVTTKILSRFVDVVAISFKESRPYFKIKNKLVLTGNPIKKEILSADKQEARKSLKLDQRPFILIFGGSLGADKINETLIEYITQISQKKELQLLAATGERQYAQIMDRLRQKQIYLEKYPNIQIVPYIYNMNEALVAADIVVCRSGAITLSEITAVGRPAILIPSPNVTNNHQEHNARTLEKRGAAVVLTENNLNGKMLHNQINMLLSDKQLLNKMALYSLKMGITNATEKIVEIIKERKAS